MPVHDYRRDPFTQADHSRYITSEGHTVPANSPFYVPLRELPRLDVPSTITVSLAAAPVSVQLAAGSWGDVVVDEATPETACGSASGLRVGDSAGKKARFLVHFDLAGLPDVARRAYLRIFLSTPHAFTDPPDTQLIGVHEVQAPWSEATTWNTQPAHNPVASGTATITASGWYDLDVTDPYNAWKAGTRANLGLMVKHGAESQQDTVQVYASSEQTSAYRPTLYILPLGATFDEVSQSVVPAGMEVAVNHDRGFLRFHPARASQRVLVDYYGTGSPVSARDVGQIDRLVGDGRDGDLVVLSGTTTLSGQKSYSSVYVAAGAVLTTNAGPHPLIIGVTGDCRIHGAVNLDGKGLAGGAGGAPFANGARGGGASGGDGGAGAQQPVLNDAVSHGVLVAALIQAFYRYKGGWCAYTQTICPSIIDAVFIPPITPGGVLALKLQQFLMPGLTEGQKASIASWFDPVYQTATIDDLATWLENNIRANAITGTGGGGGGGGSAAPGASGGWGSGQGAGAGGRGGDASAFTSAFLSEFLPPSPGGGGGGGGGSTGVTGGAGGQGGGALLLQVEGELYVDASASITARGLSGTAPNGGSGAGGALWIRACRRDIRVTPDVSGAAGAGPGGSGAAGWTLVEDL